MRRQLLTKGAIALFAVCLGCANVANVSVDQVPAGDSVVGLRFSESSRPGRWFINLHDDENTSVEAALRYIRRHGGTVLELVHSGGRNLAFELDDDAYLVDPNRIFTDTGIRETLSQLGAFTEDAAEITRNVAGAVTSRLLDARPDWIIALHNNTEGNYSLLSYLPGGPYLTDAAAIHRNHTMDADDFFFVTDEDLYFALARRNLNVVLQNNASVTDDGSLSVFSANRGLRYANVEAQHGHRRQQVRMITILGRTLER